MNLNQAKELIKALEKKIENLDNEMKTLKGINMPEVEKASLQERKESRYVTAFEHYLCPKCLRTFYTTYLKTVIACPFCLHKKISKLNQKQIHKL